MIEIINKCCGGESCLLTPSPTWINSPAAPENATAMMSPAIPSLQRHKSTSVPSSQRANAPSHFLLPFVLLSPDGNSPVESPHMVKGELQCTLQSGILGFLPIGTATMASFLHSSSLLVTWKKLPWCTYMCICVHLWVSWCVIVYTHLSEGWFCVLRIPWLQCCWSAPLQKLPLEMLTSRVWCDETRR